MARAGEHVVSFTVPGTPVPQGSKSVDRRGNMYEANKGLKVWRRLVRDVARVKYDGPPLDGPVMIAAVFSMPRPKRSKFKLYPAGKPDTDKLQRAIGDSLTAAGVLSDDARVVLWSAGKVWVDPADAGAALSVYSLGPA